MIRFLINRPIAVTMCIIAIVVVGMVSLRFIPVSLMPDIDIPQITVQVSYPGASVREMESKAIRPIRNQMMQVNGLKSIRSESRTDAGAVYMTFEPGCNIDLLFIEVNEKMDRAMNGMPRELERPKVLKASATDIPAFYLDMTLQSCQDKTGNLFYPPEPADAGSAPTGGAGRSEDRKLHNEQAALAGADVEFARLGDFAKNIVAKRIEQLPQTAMVDVSGTVSSELLCIPDEAKMRAMGVTTDLLEKAISDNNITLGVLSVADGICRYNIHFDSQLMTREDIEEICIRHEGRIYRFKELCQVIEQPAKRRGIVRNGRDNAVTLAIIKQNDAQMKDLQASIADLINDLEKEYPGVRFSLTRDQTQLLSYSISNLKSNLLVGILLASIVLFLFMRNARLPLLIVITIPLSLIITLLCFHLIGISLNIISLSGLILGVGMLVDNSIIVIDNITQKWHGGGNLQDVIAVAVREVFSPMLSSVLTTCSVFIPLIFLSGTAGALFFDQAMAVTLSLFASLAVSVLVIPVYFYAFFRKKTSVDTVHTWNGRLTDWLHQKGLGRELSVYTPYEAGIKFTLRHQKTLLICFAALIPLTLLLFSQVEKSRLPYIEYDDTLMYIDWNSGISVDENDRRTDELLSTVREKLACSTSMVGVQDFLLSHTRELTASEAVVYLKATSKAQIDEAKSLITTYMQQNYPKSVVEFEVAGNLFDMIFSTGEADLEIRLQDCDGNCPTVAMARSFTDTLAVHFPEVYFPPVAVEENIHYEADIEKMSFYGVSYITVFARLKELVSEQNLYKISYGGSSIPVTLGVGLKESRDLLSQTVTNSDKVEIPLSYIIRESRGEDFKKLYSGSGGDYYPIPVTADDATVKKIMKFAEDYTRCEPSFHTTFTGEWFASRQMVRELLIILVVSVFLLYFIMAAQFESLVQPAIILSEIVIDVCFVLAGLWISGESINIMSLIGIVVMSGIVINDSILKVDTINNLRRSGMSLNSAILTAGHSRLKPILMTSLTTILAIVPFLHRVDMGSALQYPLSLTLILGMTFGTLVSLFFVPLMYHIVYHKR